MQRAARSGRGIQSPMPFLGVVMMMGRAISRWTESVGLIPIPEEMRHGELAAGVLEGDFGGFGDFPAFLGYRDGFGVVVAEVDVDGGGSAGGADADDEAAGVAVGSGAECGKGLMEVARGEGLAVVA